MTMVNKKRIPLKNSSDPLRSAGILAHTGNIIEDNARSIKSYSIFCTLSSFSIIKSA